MAFTCDVSNKHGQPRNSITATAKLFTIVVLRHIRAKVEENRDRIVCPKDGCKQTLDPLGCKMLIPPNVFEKWCDCLCKSAISGIPRCYCPNPNCSELFLNECDDHGKVDKCMCPRCNNLFCYACRGPWHAGICCPDSNEARFARLVKQEKWKRCPGCGQTIERTFGCCSMRCRCGTFFSYEDRRNFLHRRRDEIFTLVFVFAALIFFLVFVCKAVCFLLPVSVSQKIVMMAFLLLSFQLLLGFGRRHSRRRRHRT